MVFRIAIYKYKPPKNTCPFFGCTRAEPLRIFAKKDGSICRIMGNTGSVFCNNHLLKNDKNEADNGNHVRSDCK